MTLLIDHKYDYPSFIAFLKRRLMGYVAQHVNRGKLMVLDEYFKSDSFLELYGTNNVSAYTVIRLSLTNLTYTHFPSYAILSVNDKVLYPGTNIRLVDLCKIINYGNLSVEAYPIVTDTFRHFSTHIKQYVNKYEMGVG